MGCPMDIEEYTNFREVVRGIDPRLVPPFVMGVVLGGLVMMGVLRKWWWLLVILLLWPALLYIVGMLLPLGLNVTYRIFFLGLVTLACMGLSYYLAR